MLDSEATSPLHARDDFLCRALWLGWLDEVCPSCRQVFAATEVGDGLPAVHESVRHVRPPRRRLDVFMFPRRGIGYEVGYTRTSTGSPLVDVEPASVPALAAVSVMNDAKKPSSSSSVKISDTPWMSV